MSGIYFDIGRELESEEGHGISLEFNGSNALTNDNVSLEECVEVNIKAGKKDRFILSTAFGYESSSDKSSSENYYNMTTRLLWQKKFNDSMRLKLGGELTVGRNATSEYEDEDIYREEFSEITTGAIAFVILPYLNLNMRGYYTNSNSPDEADVLTARLRPRFALNANDSNAYSSLFETLHIKSVLVEADYRLKAEIGGEDQRHRLNLRGGIEWALPLDISLNTGIARTTDSKDGWQNISAYADVNYNEGGWSFSIGVFMNNYINPNSRDNR